MWPDTAFLAQRLLSAKFYNVVFQEKLLLAPTRRRVAPTQFLSHNIKRQQKATSEHFFPLFVLGAWNFSLPRTGSKYYLPAQSSRRVWKIGVALRHCLPVFSLLISSAPVSHSADIILLSTNKGTFVFFTRPPTSFPPLIVRHSQLCYIAAERQWWRERKGKETLIQPTLCLPSAILNSGAACF